MFRQSYIPFLASVTFTVLAVAPLYVSYILDGYDYSTNLDCDPIDPQSNVIPLEGGAGRQWLGILSSCTVTNHDRHTVKINAVRATATLNVNGPLFTFTPASSDAAFDSIPELSGQAFPVTIASQAAYHFHGLYVLPIPRNWNNGSLACQRTRSAAEQPLWRASACLDMLKTDELADYIDRLRAGTIDLDSDGVESDTGYRDFSVQVRFNNGETESASLRLSAGFTAPSRTFFSSEEL